MELLTSNCDVNNPSPRVKMLLESFSQDITYAVTGVRTKSPKQFLLSDGVKTLTGNVELIRMLNRFGHGMLYSQLEENDKALCLNTARNHSTKGFYQFSLGQHRTPRGNLDWRGYNPQS